MLIDSLDALCLDTFDPSPVASFLSISHTACPTPCINHGVVRLFFWIVPRLFWSWLSLLYHKIFDISWHIWLIPSFMIFKSHCFRRPSIVYNCTVNWLPLPFWIVLIPFNKLWGWSCGGGCIWSCSGSDKWCCCRSRACDGESWRWRLRHAVQISAVLFHVVWRWMTHGMQFNCAALHCSLSFITAFLWPTSVSLQVAAAGVGAAGA